MHARAFQASFDDHFVSALHCPRTNWPASFSKTRVLHVRFPFLQIAQLALNILGPYSGRESLQVRQNPCRSTVLELMQDDIPPALGEFDPTSPCRFSNLVNRTSSMSPRRECAPHRDDEHPQTLAATWPHPGRLRLGGPGPDLDGQSPRRPGRQTWEHLPSEKSRSASDCVAFLGSANHPQNTLLQSRPFSRAAHWPASRGTKAPSALITSRS